MSIRETWVMANIFILQEEAFIISVILLFYHIWYFTHKIFVHYCKAQQQLQLRVGVTISIRKKLGKIPGGDWCFHFTEVGPFWDLVSKKFHNHSVIIHLWRLRRCIIAEISKIYWKSMIKKHQICVAKISATKAQIFIKFHVVVNLV